MRFIVLDFESLFGDDYTLSKMTTESYIRDSRFQAHGAAIKWSPNHEAKWYDEPELRFVLKQEDWSDVFMIHHHGQFDGLILSHHYDVHPKMFGDTLAMARLLIGNHISVSLESVRKHFGIPPKTTPYNLFKNKHWHELTPIEQTLVAEGACDEVESIWKIFQTLLKDMPREELELVDTTTKMFTEPCLRADLPLLAKVWTSENDNKTKRLAALNVTAAELQSSNKFADLLRAQGLEPETKESAKGNTVFAFAKTDEAMRDLLEHPNENIRALAEARIGQKSTLLQTRAETLGFSGRRGALPVYLRYCLDGATKILVDQGGNKHYKRLDTLLATDKVWDGAAFVHHSGLVYQGRQYVIEWDGIVATPDHGVFISNRHLVSLAEAKRSGFRLVDARPLQENHQNVDGNLSQNSAAKRARTLSLRLWLRRFSWVRQLNKGLVYWLSWLRQQAQTFGANEKNQQEPWKPVGQYTSTLHQQATQALETLWGAWDSKQISYPNGIYSMGAETPTPSHLFRHRNRPSRQQWSLRTGQFALSYSSRTMPQPTANRASRRYASHVVLRAASTFGRFARFFSKTGQAGAYKKADSGAREKLPLRTSQKIDVFDIYMCGPRNRFMANGKLVSNCGAHTTRWSGGDGSNWQNFKRDSNIRRAILAPEGYLLGTIDLSQIEYRILCWLAGEEDALDELRRGEDPYIDIATDVYGERIYKAAKADPRFLEMETKRGTGKQLKLSCGFQAGAATIQRTAKLGIYGPPVYIELDEAERWKKIYRDKMSKTVAYWGEAGRMIARIAGGDPLQWGPMSIREGKVFLPNGCPLHFPGLHYHVDHESGEKFWRYKNRHGWSKLYSGKLCENVVQALARVVMSQAMVRIARLGYRVVNTTHDELLLLIPRDGNEQKHLDICKAEMVREPTWLPGIPLGVEGELSERYSK